MNLSSIDLNLLVVFDALVTERSVTQAGKRLGLSQPAVSNALSRLRAAFGDPLLVRTGVTMEPTPRALELVPPVRHALSTLTDAFRGPQRFDPQHSKHGFRVCAADDIELTLLPHLLERIKHLAPGMDIAMSRRPGEVEQSLRTGHVDLYLGVWFNVPEAFRRHLLRKETFACIARRGHPQIGSELTLRSYMEAGHVVVTPTERPGSVVDTVLSDQGLGRRVVLRTPHFLVAPLVVARTDLIATLPRTIAETCAEFLELSVFNPPIDVPGFPIQMVWHPRTHEHPPHRWLREQIVHAMSPSDW